MDIITIAENNQIKFRNKYRIASTRLKNYDYSSDGAYFVTICAKDREHFFGEIKNEKMIFSEIGKIAEKYWREIPNHFPFVKLDEFVVMPNHLHGIIEICRNIGGENNIDDINICDVVNDYGDANICRDAINRVSTGDMVKTGGITGNHNPMLNPFSLSKFIRWYKGVCTFKINKKYFVMFAWQSRFYDRIIRNENELNRIREYIFSNPSNWEKDKNNAENIFI